MSYSLANDGDKINYLETYMFKRILSLMIFVTLIFITSCKTTEVTQSKKQEFTVDFAQKLQDVLQNGTIEEALALFETMPEKYQNDYSSYNPKQQDCNPAQFPYSVRPYHGFPYK